MVAGCGGDKMQFYGDPVHVQSSCVWLHSSPACDILFICPSECLLQAFFIVFPQRLKHFTMGDFVIAPHSGITFKRERERERERGGERERNKLKNKTLCCI